MKPAPDRRAAESSSLDRKSTRLNSSHQIISYAVFCLKKKKKRLDSHILLIDALMDFVRVVWLRSADTPAINGLYSRRYVHWVICAVCRWCVMRVCSDH